MYVDGNWSMITLEMNNDNVFQKDLIHLSLFSLSYVCQISQFIEYPINNE